jgi:hypothetical protein
MCLRINAKDQSTNLTPLTRNKDSSFIADLLGSEEVGAHVSHGILCRNCNCSVGGSNHLQNSKKFDSASGNEVGIALT